MDRKPKRYWRKKGQAHDDSEQAASKRELKKSGGMREKRSRSKEAEQEGKQPSNLHSKQQSKPPHPIEGPISARLQDNLDALKAQFTDCSDVIFREMLISHHIKALLVYIDGLVAATDLHANALKPLLFDFNEPTGQLIDTLESRGVAVSQLSHVQNYTKVINGLLSGTAVVFVEGQDKALMISVGGGQRRSVSEPATEAVVRGPREGFTESIRTNTSLVRHKIRSPNLKTVSFTLGEETRTEVVLTYLEGLADPTVVDEVRRRLESVKIDGILESAYIEELIEDAPYSPFPQFQYTERPDTVAANLLEGRIAIFVDGTPFVLMAPITYWQMLQASEDYYERFFIGSMLRWLRLLFLFLALYMPSLYIAVTTYHPDMLPTSLMLSVSAARETIPFPAIVEALIMEIAFEALREAGVRLPKTIGQTVSILGALIIGQAAVEAGIVSAPMVIIVSVTGIASFTIPRFNAAIAIRLMRFPLMFLAGTFGLFGIVIGTVLLAAHLSKLRSLGVPYLSGVAPRMKGELKDILFRAPWWKMNKRPTSYAHPDRRREAADMMPAPPHEKE